MGVVMFGLVLVLGTAVFRSDATSGGDTLFATVFSKGNYEAKINGEVIDSATTVYKSDASSRCAHTIVEHDLDTVTCFWRGFEMKQQGI